MEIKFNLKHYSVKSNTKKIQGSILNMQLNKRVCVSLFSYEIFQPPVIIDFVQEKHQNGRKHFCNMCSKLTNRIHFSSFELGMSFMRFKSVILALQDLSFIL